MALEELLKGLSVFESGLKTAAIGRGISDAQTQISQINQSQMKELERRQALSAVSNNLVMQLSQAGADPTQVAQVSGAIKPKELQNSQDFLALGASTGDQQVSQLGQQLQQQESAVQTGENAKQRALTREMGYAGIASSERIAGIKGERKLGETEVAQIIKKQKDFNSEAKGYFDAYQTMQNGKELLALGNPIADNMIPTLVAKTQEKGVLTDEDKKPYGGSQAFDAKFSQAMTKWSSGNLDATNKKFLTEIIAKLETNARRSIEGTADRHSRQTAAVLKLDPAEVRSRILPADWDKSLATQGQQLQPGAGALPPGVPQGSVEATFSKNGQTVKGWKTPDGKFLAPKAK